MENIIIDADDANALPTQPPGLPRKAVASPRQHRMKAHEQQQILRTQRAYFDHWLQWYMRGVVRLCRIDDIGIAAGNGTHLGSIGAGKHAGGHGRISETESAG